MSIVREELRSSKTALKNVLVNPALRRIFLAFAGSLIGDGVFSLSAVVYVYRHGGATAVGVIAFVRFVAVALVSPVTATFADQYNRKIVMVTSDLLRLVLVVSAAVLVALHASRWPVFVLIVLVGLAGTAFRPAQVAILPTLARNLNEIAGANVVSSTIESVGFFAGPALAGLLLAYANVTVAFVFDAVTFIWSALLVSTLRPPSENERSADVTEMISQRVDDPESRSQSFLGRAIQGFRYIRHDRRVVVLGLIYVLQCVVAGASAVFTVAIALKLLHIGSAGLGYMESMLGIGGLIGGFLALMLVERAHLAIDFALGVIVWAAPLLLIAIFPHLAAALFVMWLIGVANSVVDVNAITILQHMVPNDKLGRVLGAFEGAEIAGMAVGSLAMTVLIHVTGLRIGLALIGGAVTLSVLPGIPMMRRIDEEVFEDGVQHMPHGHRHFHHLRWRHR